jgi:hypothetical protein
MCTTLVECKTIITVVLMIKSGKDPHMISQDSSLFGNGWVARCSSWTWNVLVESPSWSWRFYGELFSWSWRLIVIYLVGAGVSL